MPNNNVVSGTISSGSIGGKIQNHGLSGKLSIPGTATTSDYEILYNKPRINGIELSGDLNLSQLSIVSENTTAGWNASHYIPKSGEICVYTDYISVEDDLGNTIFYPGVKIGDGNAYVVDLPFVTDGARYEVLQMLKNHAENSTIHITQKEREFWNNKLNSEVIEEELILTRN